MLISGLFFQCTSPVDGVSEIGCPTAVKVIEFSASSQPEQIQMALLIIVITILIAAVSIAIIMRQKVKWQ